jgi:signal transduction histidine kinase
VRKISILCSRLEAVDTKQEKIILKIIKACDRASDQLDAILQLSSIASGNQVEITDLNLILKRVLKTLDKNIKKQHAVINAKTLPSAPIIPGQVEQMLQSLVSNALKYCCSPHNDKPIIDVEAIIELKENIDKDLLNVMKYSNEYLQIKVRDNGIGFEQTHSSKIFDLFTRLHGNDEYEGTGIGLSICKRVAENHGGSIIAISERNKGTLFIVTLPYYKYNISE